MSMIRRRIAERLLESQNATATLTTFNEVDMSASLKVVRIAAVCWTSTRRWATRWRSPLIR